MTKRILVVEDQPDNRQIIRDMLARTDYEITEAENAFNIRREKFQDHLVRLAFNYAFNF